MSDFERIPVYTQQVEPDAQQEFLHRWGNEGFRRSRLTYFTLFFLMVLYPAQSLLFAEDPSVMFKDLSQGMLLFLLITTIIIQWCVFLLLYITAYRENTGLRGLGFRKLRGIDFAWAGAFLPVAYLLLAGVAWLLAQVGLPMPGEISLLVPTETAGRIVWVFVSITAGVCEEAAFRGYLMTRIRLLGNLKSWVAPVVISSVVFGACHSYQGIPGLILISIYGALLALLYLKTKSIWPSVIAHFFQDFLALIIPQ